MGDCRKTTNTRSNIRRLQKALYLKSKQDPSFRFYSLYDKVCSDALLCAAWQDVKANKGARGIDEVSIDRVVEQGQEKEMIERLRRRLREKRYVFSPVRRVEIPKPQGGTRPLGIATVSANYPGSQRGFGMGRSSTPFPPAERPTFP